MSDLYLTSLVGQPQDKRDAIMNVLLPFRGWRPKLKPALPDLEARANEAIFWRYDKGVCTFQQSESGPLWSSIDSSLESSLESEFELAMQGSLRSKFPASLDESSWASFRASLRTLLEESFRSSVRYAIDHVLADKPTMTAKFKPLLDLWIAGNFPVGFDRKGSLILLVA